MIMPCYIQNGKKNSIGFEVFSLTLTVSNKHCLLTVFIVSDGSMRNMFECNFFLTDAGSYSG